MNFLDPFLSTLRCCVMVGHRRSATLGDILLVIALEPEAGTHVIIVVQPLAKSASSYSVQ